ncbi:MAG: protein translocase SEC61 complex subunit gamma [Candidatus Altiarchaeota archaeon]
MDVVKSLTKAYSETRRILRLTRKPKKSEYTETARITGLGIIAIGFLGFVVFFISLVLR